MLNDYIMPNGLSADDEEQRAWYDVVGKLKDKAKEFLSLYNSIISKSTIAKSNSELNKEYSSWISRAESAKNQVQALTKKIDSVVGYVKSMIGMEGLDYIGHLGILPLIPIAVIAASLALLTKIIADGYQLNKKLTAAENLVSKGYTPTQATAVIQSTKSESFLEPVKKIVPLIVLTGAIFLILPYITKKRS